MSGQGKLLSWYKMVKQFKLFRVTCDSSAILNFVEKMKKRKNNSPDFLLRATEHTQKIKFVLYNHITKFW